MDGYGIEKNEVELAVKNGMKWKENESEKFHARMSGIECVFIKEENIIFIITVYKEGERK